MKWISVKDRMPDGDDPRMPEGLDWPFTSYLCWTKSPTGKIKDGIVEVVQFSRKYKDFQDTPCRLEITHWMPLPEAP